MSKETLAAKTIGEAILRMLADAKGPLRTRDITSSIAVEMDTSEDAVRQELTALFRAKKIIRPKHGWNDLPEHQKAHNEEELETVHRHVGYELKDELGNVAVRVTVLMQVGKPRRASLQFVGLDD